MSTSPNTPSEYEMVQPPMGGLAVTPDGKIVHGLFLFGNSSTNLTAQVGGLSGNECIGGWQDACVEWEEQCTQSETVCSETERQCTSGWKDTCARTEQECTGGFKDTCTRTATECTGGFKSVCTSTSKQCSNWLPWPLDHLCDGWKEVCTGTSNVCQGWGEVCKETGKVCQGWGDVCKETSQVCQGWGDVCVGTTQTFCKASTQVCKTPGKICSAIKTTAENFQKCMDTAASSPAISGDCAPKIEIENPCYAEARGDLFTDGFTAGCKLPTLSAGVEFGTMDEDGDKDTAVLKVGAGALQAELPLFKKQWTNSPVKEHVYLDASTSIAFVNDARLDFYGGNDFRLTLPGAQWDLDTTLGLMASKAVEPCADDDSKCKMVLNKGREKIFQKAFAAGPVPIVIAIRAEVYMKALPKMEGGVESLFKVYLADNGVPLLNSVQLHLSNPGAALQGIQQMVDADALKQAIKSNLRVEVSGKIEATAEVKLCVGVEISFSVNGIGSTIDVPVCLTGKLEVAANADLSAADLEVTASLTQEALEFDFELDLPDPGAVVDTACGFVQPVTGAIGDTVGQCVPVVDCMTNLVDDACNGLSDAVADLELKVELGKLSVIAEQELWSKQVTLSTNAGGGGWTKKHTNQYCRYWFQRQTPASNGAQACGAHCASDSKFLDDVMFYSESRGSCYCINSGMSRYRHTQYDCLAGSIGRNALSGYDVWRRAGAAGAAAASNTANPGATFMVEPPVSVLGGVGAAGLWGSGGNEGEGSSSGVSIWD